MYFLVMINAKTKQGAELSKTNNTKDHIETELEKRDATQMINLNYSNSEIYVKHNKNTKGGECYLSLGRSTKARKS